MRRSLLNSLLCWGKYFCGHWSNWPPGRWERQYRENTTPTAFIVPSLTVGNHLFAGRTLNLTSSRFISICDPSRANTAVRHLSDHKSSNDISEPYMVVQSRWLPFASCVTANSGGKMPTYGINRAVGHDSLDNDYFYTIYYHCIPLVILFIL